MDKLQWFKFAPSDWMMGKIMRCDEITQARYMRLVCLYWNKECNLSYEDAEIEIDKKHLDILVKKKIVKIDDDFVYIEFLDEQMEGISETSEKRRAAVKKRWDKVKQNKAKELQSYTSVLQNDTEERRGEETREEKDNILDFEKFTSWFNVRRTQYLEIPSNIKRLTHSEKITLGLLKKDYSKDDFELAMYNLCNDDWSNKNNQVLCSYFLQTKIFNKFLSMEKKPMLTKRQRTIRGGLG